MREGRHRTWYIETKIKNGLTVIDLIFLQNLANFIFDSRYEIKIVNDPQTGTEKGWIIGEMRIRRRLSYLSKKLNEYYNNNISNPIIDCYSYNIVSLSLPFENVAKGNVILVKNDSSDYKAEDIKKLDFIENRFPWQNDLLELIFDKSGERFLKPDDLIINWIEDSVGSVGKYRLVKWLCSKNQNDILKLNFASSNQLRSAIISNKARKCYIFDLSGIIIDVAPLMRFLKVIEELKNGHIISSSTSNKSLLMDIPHIIIFADISCPKKKLIQNR